MTELLKRSLTSIVLLTLLVSAYWFLSPMLLSAVIKAIYCAAFICEYIPLARRSMHMAPYATVFAGCALIMTGILHAYWASDQSKHMLLGLCIFTAVLSDVGGYIFWKVIWKASLSANYFSQKNVGRLGW